MIAGTPTTTGQGRYQIVWGADNATKRVEIISRDTGCRTVGTDWTNWDAAYRQALNQMFRSRAN